MLVAISKFDDGCEARDEALYERFNGVMDREGLADAPSVRHSIANPIDFDSQPRYEFVQRN